MNQPSTRILGVNISTRNKTDLLSAVGDFLGGTSGTLLIVTPNPEQLMLAADDPAFADILNSADIALPDGQGVVWASKHRIQQRIPGVEFMQDLTALASEKNIPVAFVGGYEDVSKKSLSALQRKQHDLTGFATGGPMLTENGQYGETAKELAQRIGTEKVGMVFLAFGAPKQEKFAAALREALKKLSYKKPVIIMVVGGSFDFISGRVKRAPLWMRNNGLEWLWRLLHEPWRIGRQLQLVHFVYRVLTQPKS